MYIVPGPREAAVALHRGLPVAALAAQIFGNANDIGRGHQPAGHAVSPRALNVTPASLLPATQLPHAAGIAWAMKMQGGRSWRWRIWIASRPAPRTFMPG